MKKLLLLAIASTLLTSCSNDEPSGHGKISMKIDGVLYEYTDISVGFEHTSDLNGNPADVLYIRAEDEDNTFEHREAFVFRPYRGGTFDNQILIAARIVNEGALQEYSWYARQEDLTECIFYQNDAEGFKGRFEGQLRDGAEILEVTDGTIEIVYGNNNYGFVPDDFGK
ncbi:hypothetical protein [Flavobacterium sp.]